MRKAHFAFAAILLLAACKKAPEATHGVDTTLNDTPEAKAPEDVALTEPVTTTEAKSSQTERQMSDESIEGDGEEELAGSDKEPSANVDLSRNASAGYAGDWITNDDYPPSALRNNEEGTVVISWDINEQGRVENCHVTSSSGSDALDRASCAAITRRGRYSPALDRSGNPIRSSASRRVKWAIPKSE